MRLGLRTLDRAIKRSVLACIRRPGRVLGLSAAIFLLAIVSASRLRQSVSIRDQLDPRMASTRELELLGRLFPSDPNLLLLVHPPATGFFDADTLCRLMRAVAQAERTAPGVEISASPLSPRRAHWVSPHLAFPRMVPDPCGAGEGGARPLDGLRGSPWAGTLTDAGARDVIFSFHVDPVDPPGRQGRFNSQGIGKLVADIEKGWGGAVSWLGSSAQEFYMMRGLEGGTALNAAVVAVIWVGFRLLFGTWLAGAIFIGTLAFTGAILLGGMAAVGHPIDVLSSCLFVLLAVATVEDLVFVSHARLSARESWKRVFVRLSLPGFFTSVTTMIGFGSLVTSHLLSIARFGGWACLGSFLEWGAIFLLLPAACARFPRLRAWIRPERSFLRGGFARASRWKPRRLLSRACLLAFPLAAVATLHFRVAQDPSEVFTRSHPARQAWEWASERLGWKASASLIFRPEVGAARKRAILADLEGTGLVSRTESFDAVSRFVTQGIADRGILEFIDRTLRDPANFGKPYFADTGEERALLYLTSTATDDLSRLRARAVSLCPAGECILAGDFIAFADFSQSFIGTLFESLFWSLALVALVLFWLARGIGTGSGSGGFVRIALSSFWGPACILAVMGMFGTSVNSVTCVVASTVVGLTGDNAVQFLFASGRRGSLTRGIDRMGTASIQSALLMIVFSLVLLASDFAPVRDLSLLFVVGFATSLIGDLWLLRGLDSEVSE